MKELFIGLMSGTSLDGVDGVLVDFSKGFKVLAYQTEAFTAAFKSDLLSLNAPGENELHRASLCANELARIYARVCSSLLSGANVSAHDVSAVGAHGQTVRHRPHAFDGTGYTLQLNNPALTAELTGIRVCADFRTRDVAAGGQGAPLVPAFHQSLFEDSQSTVCVLNLGGISNLSVLPAAREKELDVIGFDCGPANCLMDEWCLRHTGNAFDAAGAWAAQGQVIEPLLQIMLEDPYFALPAPKSSGRDLFNMDWLALKLKQLTREHADVDLTKPTDLCNVQTTLARLCVQSCVDSIMRYASDASRLIVCGGGALNAHVMNSFKAALPNLHVAQSGEFGLPPLQVEAAAFAWLARRCVRGETGSLKSVTGARGARILGAIYQA